MAKEQTTTGVEIAVDPDRLLVSKTDLSGKILYFNDYFRQISRYGPRELMGAPHSLIRHPDMPRAVFKRMWTQIAETKREIFAFVVNRAANGDHYWAVAHVTPSFSPQGALTGYHSNRRAADSQAVRTVIAPLYAEMRAAEAAADRKSAPDAGLAVLARALEAQGVDYDEFVVRLATGRAAPKAAA